MLSFPAEQVTEGIVMEPEVVCPLVMVESKTPRASFLGSGVSGGWRTHNVG